MQPATDPDGHCAEVGVSDPELAVVTRPPAEGHVVRVHPAAVMGGRAHLAEPASAANYHRLWTVGGGTIAKLTTVVVTPTVSPIIGGHPAGVADAGAYLEKHMPTSYRDGLQATSVERAALAELAGVFWPQQ